MSIDDYARTGARLARPAKFPQKQETALLAIIGIDAGGGGGCYQGNILRGQSTGMDGTKEWGLDSTVIPTGNDPQVGKFDFQLTSSYVSNIVDGPYPAVHGTGQYTNNALVINLYEQYVPGSHLLYVDMDALVYVIGKYQGMTDEDTPRAIYYVQPVINIPLIVMITGAEQSGEYGWYYGKIAPGFFGQDSVTGGDPPAIPDVLPANANCWVGNISQNGKSTGALPINEPVVAFLVGYGGGPIPSVAGQPAGTYNYVAFTFTTAPANPPSFTPVAIGTTQTALATYTSNEEAMLNSLRQDVNNLHDALAALYTTLVSAGLCG